ncbi:HtaA domain-containing protein [Flavimobilis sp. GY10621]|uniref:HtaA domain-containing protein n=1 Tax=Flavimobilis rhizosphaerae TaxID=2775421 RepID=A0ABR9DLA1_9MICO|nr:HtaA domain-containing protein [Flavimobilis rhizosphaerae]MBD9697924.1 HtaA domain-containing protein [Flavimobilis rhizosphaerae]
MTEELPLQLLSRARSAVAALAVLAVTLTAAVVGLAAPASAEPAGPTVTVSKVSGLLDGETVTVRGTGFVAEGAPVGSRPPLAGKFTGIYVGFGRFAADWKPSAGAPSSARVLGDNKWAVLAADVDMIGGSARGAIELAADGSFETTLTLTRTEAMLAASGEWGIYTFPGSGAKHAAYETATPVTFAPPAPTVTVSKVSGLLDGETVTVRGTGFVAEGAPVGSRPPLAGKFTGIYVGFGRFAADWKPSAGAPSSARVLGDNKWAVLAADVDMIGGSARGAIELAADGSFETTLTLTRTEAMLAASGEWGIYTYPGSGAKHAAYETATPVTFAPATPPTTEPTDGSTATPTDKPSDKPTDKPTDEPSGEPSDEPTDTSTSTPPSCTVDDTVASSSLAWGIKRSFVDYLTGPIAGGKVTRTGVGLEDGRFVWSKGTGTATPGRASVAFPGSLRLTGHHDELDMTLSDVRLVVTSATRGEIRVDASIRAYLGNPAQRLDDVVVGTVDLTGAVTTSGATTRIVNAPVTLVASGEPVFAGFYKAGDALEPVSATLTVTETCDVPGTDEPGTDTPTTTPAPRVTIGGDADGTAVEQGGTVTFTTTGLPARASTSAEVRSDPVRLGTRRASARGSVTYTFKVPASFPTGRHTFVLTAAGVEGSVKRSFRVVAASEPTTAPSDGPTVEPSDTATTSDAPTCTARVVAGATLSWAIKDSFVSYIEGTIAQGSIATSGSRRSGGKFTWSGGSGALNTVDSRGTVRFAGSVTTSGHDGKLEVRFANPRVVVAGSTGYLVLDVAGTTLEGEDFAYSGLTFATLALAGHGGTSGGRIAYSGVPATLTAAGAKAFSGFYEAGEQLAPVAFTLPLGAETDCTPDSGTLPTTGAETAGLGGVAAAFVVLGLGFVALQRRRARLEA